jgi:glyoxylase-like metal-dependent hydrolase (beta-lactamase superfamily II)
MAMDFDTRFEPRHGEAVPMAAGVVRVTAPNAGPFTFHGTNSYIIGDDRLIVIDPGPEDDDHYDALMRAIDGRPVSHILVTHTHRDHSPLAARLKEATGAPTAAEGVHRPARAVRPGEEMRLDASGDTSFVPDLLLRDGDAVGHDGWTLRTVLTPGHAANHAAFALEGSPILFPGDHVMAWATTVVAPPDGSMADYMASLEKLLQRPETLYLPGHGGPVVTPHAHLRGLRTHRRMRERAILERLSQGDRTIPDIVAAIYRDTDSRLHGAAGLSVLAHLEDLVARGAVNVSGELSLAGRFAPAV